MSDSHFTFGQRVAGGLFNINQQSVSAGSAAGADGGPYAEVRAAGTEVRADLGRLTQEPEVAQLAVLLDELDDATATEGGPPERLHRVFRQLNVLTQRFEFLASVARLRQALDPLQL
ncbi:hypothetical protein ACFWP7_18535 [Streptomyces sp. NPDC058470]|uniref:hypothetical protein n=1 Tax=Streptomyces sp. NPDC058470 TaxID=3346515 RepID=UPI00364D0401